MCRGNAAACTFASFLLHHAVPCRPLLYPQAFDELLLLKPGGATIYSGPLGDNSEGLISFFQVRSRLRGGCPQDETTAGYIDVSCLHLLRFPAAPQAIPGVQPCPERYNPANWWGKAQGSYAPSLKGKVFGTRSAPAHCPCTLCTCRPCPLQDAGSVQPRQRGGPEHRLCRRLPAELPGQVRWCCCCCAHPCLKAPQCRLCTFNLAGHGRAAAAHLLHHTHRREMGTVISKNAEPRPGAAPLQLAALSAPGPREQLLVNLRRNFTIYNRAPEYNLTRALITILVGFAFGARAARACGGIGWTAHRSLTCCILPVGSRHDVLAAGRQQVHAAGGCSTAQLCTLAQPALEALGWGQEPPAPILRHSQPCRTTVAGVLNICGVLFSSTLFVGISNCLTIQHLISAQRTVFYR